ncbi:MAG: hypothetical protein FJ041_04560 [Candidatus Cloacimonetes bacterium]|nr:hypothetical protein [Candidatus Cloacimonadota bacterium]
MKWILISLCLVCLFLFSCFWGSSILFLESDTHNRPNLVNNPSFEVINEKNPDLPDGWLIVSSSADTNVPTMLDIEEFSNGEKSFKIAKCTKDLYIVSDAFKINFTGGYYTKCSAKSSLTMQKPIRVFFWAYDSAGSKKNSFSKSIKGRPEWKKASISSGFLNNSVSFARIAIFIPKDTENTVWIDDVGCYLVHQFTQK